MATITVCDRCGRGGCQVYQVLGKDICNTCREDFSEWVAAGKQTLRWTKAANGALRTAIIALLSDKGGMFVTLEGPGLDGQPLALTWHLVAEQNHGPYVPCGAAVALTRKLASEGTLPAGAMPCVGLLGVDEYLAPLEGLSIREIPPA